MSVYEFPNIPASAVGRKGTLYRDGLISARGKITALFLDCMETHATGSVQFDGMTTASLYSPDGKHSADCKLEVSD